MGLMDTIRAIVEREQKGEETLEHAMREADKIRYAGEEQATEEYWKIRKGLRTRIKEYKLKYEKNLVLLEKKLINKQDEEEKKMSKSLRKKQSKAIEEAYEFLVSGYGQDI